MTVVTPLVLIQQSLKMSGVLGIGQTANPEDTNDAFLQINMMLSQWQRKRWLVYALETYSKVSTGAVSYTVGPGQDFDVARPDKLESAFFRQLNTSQPNQIDYPLQIIQSREDYNLIAIKQLQSFPMYIFYDSAFPIGSVFPWPVPQSTIYSIHITLKAVLSQLLTLTQSINLPPEYYAAIQWNLSKRLRAMYQLPEDSTINQMAKDSLNVIRMANTQISTLQMPSRLIRDGLYNVFSDQTY